MARVWSNIPSFDRPANTDWWSSHFFVSKTKPMRRPLHHANTSQGLSPGTLLATEVTLPCEEFAGTQFAAQGHSRVSRPRPQQHTTLVACRDVRGVVGASVVGRWADVRRRRLVFAVRSYCFVVSCRGHGKAWYSSSSPRGELANTGHQARTRSRMPDGWIHGFCTPTRSQTVDPNPRSPSLG